MCLRYFWASNCGTNYRIVVAVWALVIVVSLGKWDISMACVTMIGIWIYIQSLRLSATYPKLAEVDNVDNSDSNDIVCLATYTETN